MRGRAVAIAALAAVGVLASGTAASAAAPDHVGPATPNLSTTRQEIDFYGNGEAQNEYFQFNADGTFADYDDQTGATLAIEGRWSQGGAYLDMRFSGIHGLGVCRNRMKYFTSFSTFIGAYRCTAANREDRPVYDNTFLTLS